jgi:N6-L-threonylcarbamoyladenine synthase
MLVLGIETTCDETAVAVVKNGREILSNIIFSQVPLHKKFGGVFPEVASRSHVDKMIPVLKEALEKADINLNDIDLIAAASNPGLIGSILVGLNTAKSLSLALNIPLIGINHIEAHLYASMMGEEKLLFPALGVVISGGHTMLLKIIDIGKYEKIGSTIDDAIGECFDKVATILDLPYPGGPEIEKLAADGIDEYNFLSSKMKDNPYNFSFSGLKTKILYTVKGQSSTRNSPNIIKDSQKKDIAKSFQRCAFSDLIEKSIQASKEFNLRAIYFGGGVSNNQTLRKMFEEKTKIPLFWPLKGLSLDNGAMIAGLAFHKYKNNKINELNILPSPSYHFDFFSEI